MLAKSEVFLACKDQFGLFILRRSQFSDHYSWSVLKDTRVITHQNSWTVRYILLSKRFKELYLFCSSDKIFNDDLIFCVAKKRKKSIISALKREGKKTCGLKLDKFTLWNYVGSFSVDNLLLEQLSEVC